MATASVPTFQADGPALPDSVWTDPGIRSFIMSQDAEGAKVGPQLECFLGPWRQMHVDPVYTFWLIVPSRPVGFGFQQFYAEQPDVFWIQGAQVNVLAEADSGEPTALRVDMLALYRTVASYYMRVAYEADAVVISEAWRYYGNSATRIATQAALPPPNLTLASFQAAGQVQTRQYSFLQTDASGDQSAQAHMSSYITRLPNWLLGQL